MPAHKPPCSLYQVALERLQCVIADYAVHLALGCDERTTITSFCGQTPRKVLEDIVNTFDGGLLKSSRELCFYYLLTLRPDITRFVVTKVNSTFSIYEWNELFVRNNFQQLTWLDCGRNCTDHVLYLISLNCPNLEYLNAMSRRKPFIMGSNATLLHDRITDIGIEFVAQKCQRLRTLVMNDPRNGADPSPITARRQSIHTISTTGYRLLLRSIAALEYISYANIGGIIATQMENVDSLNLRLIQHYNPTVVSIQEIIRLCPKMEKLHLVSFVNCPSNQAVLAEIVTGRPPLTALNLKNMSTRTQIPSLCATFKGLIELNLTETFDNLSSDNLLSIGELLPYLKHLHITGYRSDHQQQPSSLDETFRNRQFLGHLETMSISFVGQLSEKAFDFCVSNSGDSLRYISLTVDTPDEEMIANVARQLMERYRFPQLNELLLFPGLVTSMEEVLDLITHFPHLENFTGWCLGDISPISCLIQEHNLNFTFSNIKRRSILD